MTLAISKRLGRAAAEVLTSERESILLRHGPWRECGKRDGGGRKAANVQYVMHAAVLNWVDVEAPTAFRLDAGNSSQRIATATQVGLAFPSGLAASSGAPRCPNSGGARQ